MKLTTKYASLIDLDTLTDHEAATVAAFSADVMKAHLDNNPDGIKKACACLMSLFPDSVILKISKVIDGMNQSPAEKTALSGAAAFRNLLDHTKSPIAAPLLGSVIITSLATVIPQLLSGALSSTGKLIDRLFDTTGAQVMSVVFRTHPELAADKEQTLANYATIQKFSPTMASDANAVGHLLSNIHQLDGKITYTTLSELSKIEQQLAQAKEKTSPGGFQGFGKNVGEAYQGMGADVSKKVFSEGAKGIMGNKTGPFANTFPPPT